MMRSPLLKDQAMLFIFVSVVFVVGLVFGALLVNALTLDQQQNLAGDVQLLAQRIETGMLQEAGQSFADRTLYYGKWLLLVWVLGVTVVGIPLVLALDFFKGVLVGFAVAALVHQYEWKGLFFSLLSVAPQNLLVVPALITASVSALSFAIYVVRSRLLGSRSGHIGGPLLSHTIAAVLMILVSAGAALVEIYVSPPLLHWAAPLIGGAGSGL